MTNLSMLESLRLCRECGHTRDRHSNGEACGTRGCWCVRFVPGELSPEGLRESNRLRLVSLKGGPPHLDCDDIKCRPWTT